MRRLRRSAAWRVLCSLRPEMHAGMYCMFEAQMYTHTRKLVLCMNWQRPVLCARKRMHACLHVQNIEIWTQAKIGKLSASAELGCRCRQQVWTRQRDRDAAAL
jgi:hypothetical protein